MTILLSHESRQTIIVNCLSSTDHMGRIHLFGFEDQKWFPDFLRNYGTDFLQWLANRTKMYRPVVPFDSVVHRNPLPVS